MEYETAIKVLGSPGAMLSWSKSEYRNENPNNLVVYNSNVCTNKGKIWYGDLDLTKSGEKLKELAKALDQTIYVLYEMDGRFENEKNPRLEKFVYKVSPNGEAEINK